MSKESPASAPMRIGGKAKQSTLVESGAKPSDPEGTGALKRSTNASKHGKEHRMAVRGKIETREMQRHAGPKEGAETGKMKGAVKKAEGRQPPKEGMGSVGAKMGRDRDYGRSLENAGQTARKVRARNT